MGKSETSVQCIAQEHLAGSVLEKSSFSPLAGLLDLMPVRTNSEVQRKNVFTGKPFIHRNRCFSDICADDGKQVMPLKSEDDFLHLVEVLHS